MYARQPKTTTFLMKNCLTVFEIKLQAIYITVCIEVTLTLCSFDDHLFSFFTANSSSTCIYSNGEGLEKSYCVSLETRATFKCFIDS